MAKAIKHQGVTIHPVQLTRYEVRDAKGVVVRRFDKIDKAKAYIDGYVRAIKTHGPREDAQ